MCEKRVFKHESYRCWDTGAVARPRRPCGAVASFLAIFSYMSVARTRENQSRCQFGLLEEWSVHGNGRVFLSTGMMRLDYEFRNMRGGTPITRLDGGGNHDIHDVLYCDENKYLHYRQST